MHFFSILRSIYSLNNLDPRLTSSVDVLSEKGRRTDPAKIERPGDRPIQGVPVRVDSRTQKVLPEPSKWNTPEFYFYYFIFITIVPYMFWVPYSVSRPSHPNYAKFEHLLSPGWIPGRKIDISDSQYATFRGNLPYLAALLCLHPLLRRIYENTRPTSTSSSRADKSSGNNAQTSALQGTQRLDIRASFDFGFAIIFLAALHGFSALKILLILYINFRIATQLPRQHVPLATWTFNIATLFINELSEGYNFTRMETIFPGLVPGMAVWGGWVDSYGGLIPRWEILFNLTVLRMISFNLDYYWSLDKRAGSPIEKKQLDLANLSERDRIRTSADAQDYKFRNYVAYAIYAPLYLTGPIFTFNDYVAQQKHKPRSIERRRTVIYGIRFLLVLLTMEVVLHFDYCVAISKADPNWSDYSPVQLSLLSYFNLNVLWLKLLIPWRLFRLWSLIDGVDPPENMLRCISNTFSTLAFWRSWHRSYNKWLIRYLYVPLGGSGTRGQGGVPRAILNYILVFTFVALWHDIKLNLLIWGWLIVFFMLPELAAGFLFPRRKWLDWPNAYRYLCAIGAIGNVLMMMSANLVGFAVGVDGLKSIVNEIWSSWSGIGFLVAACATLFVGIQVMFETREAEMRDGIYLRC